MKRLFLAGIAACALAASLTAPTAQASTTASHPLTSPLRFTLIQYNSPGNDNGSNASLNAEWVDITNTGAVAHSLNGMHVHDAGNLHRYTFGTFTLGAHNTVRLHTGTGPNGAANRYWGLSEYVWNNDGDTATLTLPDGTVIDTCSWKDPNELHNQVHC